MDLVRFYSKESALSPVQSQPTSLFGSPFHSSSHTSFPIIAVAIIGILATAFLLVGYYVFAIKCCLNWHRIDLLRPFSFSRSRRRVQDPLVVNSLVVEDRGLDEAAIRSIPIFKFKKCGTNEKYESFDKRSSDCAVCLNDFQGEEKLRMIPNCGHVFHIDCIDIWLQNNSNCPLCRTSVLATKSEMGVHFDISPSRQDPNPYYGNSFAVRDEDYVVIEIRTDHHSNPSFRRIHENEFLSITPSPRKLELMPSRKKAKKLNHVSSMGDECIVNMKKNDEQFAVQPIRRSFSMDSAANEQLYLAVQDIIVQQQRHNRHVISEGCCSRLNRSFFSFGQ